MFKDIFPKKRLIIWFGIFLLVSLMAMINYSRFVTSALAEGNPGKFQYYFIMETTGAYTVLLLLPFVLWFMKKFPINRKNLYTHIPLHLLTSMVYGASHTTLMYLSRNLIFRLADLGTYDYGRMIYRYPMEYTHQFITYWTIFGIVVFIKYIRENQKQKIRASKLEQQLTKARLQALQMQLNPHFLFNTLNLISSTMQENIEAADKMLANLSDLLRVTLNSSNWEEHSLEKELELLKLYLEIMEARFEDKLFVKMDVDNNTLEALVPGFVLQPLVENSIVHCMENLNNTEIEISSRLTDNRLLLVIDDNGPGITDETDQIMNSGIGLSNTAERLEKLYGSDHSFHLENASNGGLRIIIDIPFRPFQGKDLHSD